MTSSLPKLLTSEFAPAQHLPPLSNGDRLTSREFERRYRAMPELKKAELIEGVVYMASPLRFESHANPTAISSVGCGPTKLPHPSYKWELNPQSV